MGEQHIRTPVLFKTKIFYNGHVYLLLDDVQNALGCEAGKLADIICSIPDVGGQYIMESEYNKLLCQNEAALARQSEFEVTKVDTLRNVIATEKLKLPFFVESEQKKKVFALKHDCENIEEYVERYIIPEIRKNCLREMNYIYDNNLSYKFDVSSVCNKQLIDIRKLKEYELDIKIMTQIDKSGQMTLISYVVGDGIFIRYSNYTGYMWQKLRRRKDGTVHLPYIYPDGDLTAIDIDISSSPFKGRDFRKYNILQNLCWCMENVNISTLDGTDSVISYHSAWIDFDISYALTAKMLCPDKCDIIYLPGIVKSDARTICEIEEFEEMLEKEREENRTWQR